MSVTNMTSENFKALTENTQVPVLIDFFAPWCSPCRMLSPIIDEIAEEAKAVKVCKVNIDDEQNLAAKFSVMSVPTLVLIKDNQISSMVGLRSKAEILEFING